MKKNKKLKTYRVYISQVNQTYFELKAENEHEAKEKGYAKWKKNVNSYVNGCEEVNVK